MRGKPAGVRDEMHTQIKGILLLAVAVFCYAGLQYTEQSGQLGSTVHNVLRTLAEDGDSVLS